MGYSPCLECYRKYGRGYRETCNQICDYAVCCQRLNALMVDRRNTLVVLEQPNKQLDKMDQLIEENGRLLNRLH